MYNLSIALIKSYLSSLDNSAFVLTRNMQLGTDAPYGFNFHYNSINKLDGQ